MTKSRTKRAMTPPAPWAVWEGQRVSPEVEAKADEILTQWNKAGAATTIEELRAAFWALRHALAAADIPLAYMQFVAASRIGGLIRAYGRSLLAPAAYRALEDVFEMDVVPVSEEGATRSWMIVPRAPANS